MEKGKIVLDVQEGRVLVGIRAEGQPVPFVRAVHGDLDTALAALPRLVTQATQVAQEATSLPEPPADDEMAELEAELAGIGAKPAAPPIVAEQQVAAATEGTETPESLPEPEGDLEETEEEPEGDGEA